MFSQGVSLEGDLLGIGEDMGIVKKNGSFYSFGDTKLGQGRENSKTFLRDNSEIAESIEKMIRKNGSREESN